MDRAERLVMCSLANAILFGYLAILLMLGTRPARNWLLRSRRRRAHGYREVFAEPEGRRNPYLPGRGGRDQFKTTITDVG
jgi:hypothetical protein